MNEPKPIQPLLPPRTIRVIIRDDSPLVFCGDTPAFRSVAIELTDEQMQACRLMWVGKNCGRDVYESISRCFFELE
jgi:hypothetical protein